MKRLIVLIILLVFLILGINSVSAEKKQVKAYAYVTLTILNRPPAITSLIVTPQEAYEDSILDCKAVISDEVPEKVILHYKWYKNGVLLDEKSNNLAGFKADDKITCSAIPEDDEHAFGEEKIAEITIKSTPTTTRVIQTFVNTLGARANTEKTVELQNQGLTAITGYVVKESPYVNMSGLLIVLIIVLALVNIRFYLKYSIKRKERNSLKI